MVSQVSERDPNWDELDAWGVTGSSSWRQPEGTLRFTFDILGTLNDKYAEISGALPFGSGRDYVVAELTAGNLYYFFVGASVWSPRLDIFDSEGYRLLTLDGDDIGVPDQIGLDSIYLFSPTVSGSYRVGISFGNDSPVGDWELLALEDIGGDFANGSMPAGSRVSIAPLDAVKAEGAAGTITNFTFTVTRTGSLSAGQEVFWFVSESGANPADEADFVDPDALGGLITFAAGETQRQITVQVAGDAVLEPHETFEVRLFLPSPGLVIGQSAASARILADESSTLTIAPIVILEEDTFYSWVVVTATRTGDLSPWSGTWQLSESGDNPAGQLDFLFGFAPDGIVFDAGEITAEIGFFIKNDVELELDETFRLRITEDRTGRTFDATGTILDNDSFVTLSGPTTALVEGTGAGRQLTFTATRTSPPNTTLSVAWKVEGSGPSRVDAADFAGNALPQGVITFAPFETEKTFTVTLAGDSTPEAAERLRVVLFDPSLPIRLPAAPLEVTVQDDDPSIGVIASQSSVLEGSGTAVFARFVVTRLETSESQDVDWSIVGVGANPVDDTDFANSIPPAGRITFMPGESSLVVMAQLRTDSALEADETMEIRLADPSGGLTFVNRTARMVLLNDDADVTFVGPTVITEGQPGDAPVTLTLHRAGYLGGELAVDWSVQPFGTPAERATEADFVGGVLPTGTAVFAAGAATTTFTIPIQGDRAFEPSETFRFRFEGGRGVSLPERHVTLTIQSDDAGFSLAAPRIAAEEGSSGFIIGVWRTGTSVTGDSIGWRVVLDGLAGPLAEAADFVGGVLPSGRLTFAAGQAFGTFAIPVLDDLLGEPVEHFAVEIFDPAGGGFLQETRLTGTIRDDDAAIHVEADPVILFEGSGTVAQARYRIWRDDPAGVETVDWRILGAGPDPISEADFAGSAFPSGRVTFADGEQERFILVPLRADSLAEADETMEIRLSVATGGPRLGTDRALTVVRNDDARVWFGLPTSHAEGDAGVTDFVATLRREGYLGAAADIPWTILLGGSSAADAADFAGGVLPSGVAHFAAGSDTAEFIIPLQGDTIPEASHESFNIVLGDVAPGIQVVQRVQPYSILDDEPRFRLGGVAPWLMEGQGGTSAIGFTIHRDLDAGGTDSVGWRVTLVGVSGQRATAADFAGGSLPSGQVTFAPGETAMAIGFGLVSDAVAELDETYAIELFDPSPGSALGYAKAFTTIRNDDATVTIAAAAAQKPEGQSGLTALTFTVTRGGELGAAQSVRWSVAGSGANPADAEDFAGRALPGGVLDFAAGETSKAITVQVRGDRTQEANEGFVVTLADPSAGLSVTGAGAAGVILNDDTAVFASIAQPARAEGQTFTFAVQRRGPLDQAQSVDWTVVPSGPDKAGAVDFPGGVLPSGRLDFVPGETVKTVQVQVQADRQLEPHESFALRLLNPTNGLLLGAPLAVATVLNDDSIVSVAGPGALREGDAGLTPFTFTLTRSGELSEAQEVAWAVTPLGPDKPGLADFAAGTTLTGRVGFVAGQTTVTVTLAVAGDQRLEADESFQLRLLAPSAGLSLGTRTAVATILDDDDAPPHVSIGAEQLGLAEGHAGTNPEMRFTVTRSGPTDGAASVDWSVDTVPWSGFNAGDFLGGIAPGGTLAFAPGEAARTISFRLRGDAEVEPDEAVVVRLANPSAGLAIGVGEARSTLLDDDIHLYVWDITVHGVPAPAEGNGGGSAPLALRLGTRAGTDIDTAFTVDLRVEGVWPNPVTAADFVGGVLPSGRILVEAGAQKDYEFTLPVLADAFAEADETYRIVLSAPKGMHLHMDTLTILNDDDPFPG